ncbi:MAG: redoxin domain-containing protein, partial [Leptospiraceae bacterium]|nr:redoxin domain-containing protein [Leptospiraceae bacterium]
RVAPYIERHAMDYPIVYDADGRISYAYGVQALPTMVWIDAEGVVEDISHGMEFALTRKLRYWVTGSIFSDS